ncbi:MAG TPA: ligase-associated DNA damage response endonuclease PdeM [Niabella sp.]|nr:ligase-associated DNA damage response endonuclease PdeM [Niabella sp.]
MEIICNKELLVLLVERAIYWPRKQVLFLADMHLGKTGYFRSRGIPIPSTVMTDDLKRLAMLIETYQPRTIIVAGDMFHHDYNADIHLFKQWRESFADIDFVLVPGNHDKLMHINYEALGIRLTGKDHVMEPFFITHHDMKDSENGFVISGHIHPGYIITGKARQSYRMPCFIVSAHRMVLPAFSAFTGLYTGYDISPSDKYYLIGNETIFCI